MPLSALSAPSSARPCSDPFQPRQCLELSAAASPCACCRAQPLQLCRDSSAARGHPCQVPGLEVTAACAVDTGQPEQAPGTDTSSSGHSLALGSAVIRGCTAASRAFWQLSGEFSIAAGAGQLRHFPKLFFPILHYWSACLLPVLVPLTMLLSGVSGAPSIAQNSYYEFDFFKFIFNILWMSSLIFWF